MSWIWKQGMPVLVCFVTGLSPLWAEGIGSDPPGPSSVGEVDRVLNTAHGNFIYTVKPGDSLYEIARQHHTTVELIRRMNHLAKDMIRDGAKLKISKAVFSIHIDKSDNALTLLADGETIKTYPVATGRNNSTPAGTFTIENKLIEPTWYKAGAAVPPSSPDNILGTRWLGFSLASFGIHGTTLPETIGTQASDGCVRMRNQDVEELYDLVPVKTSVTVVD